MAQQGHPREWAVKSQKTIKASAMKAKVHRSHEVNWCPHIVELDPMMKMLHYVHY